MKLFKQALYRAMHTRGSDCNGENNYYPILTSRLIAKKNCHYILEAIWSIISQTVIGLEVPNRVLGKGGPNSEVAYLHFVPCLCCNIPESISVIQIVVWNLVDLYMESLKRYV